MSGWVYQYPSLQAKTASELGHGDVAILNPHMWRHEHTIYQTKFKVKQTQTELKIKKKNRINQSILQAGCDEVFMEFHSQRSHYDCDS